MSKDKGYGIGDTIYCHPDGSIDNTPGETITTAIVSVNEVDEKGVFIFSIKPVNIMSAQVNNGTYPPYFGDTITVAK